MVNKGNYFESTSKLYILVLSITPISILVWSCSMSDIIIFLCCKILCYFTVDNYCLNSLELVRQASEYFYDLLIVPYVKFVNSLCIFIFWQWSTYNINIHTNISKLYKELQNNKCRWRIESISWNMFLSQKCFSGFYHSGLHYLTNIWLVRPPLKWTWILRCKRYTPFFSMIILCPLLKFLIYDNL